GSAPRGWRWCSGSSTGRRTAARGTSEAWVSAATSRRRSWIGTTGGSGRTVKWGRGPPSTSCCRRPWARQSRPSPQSASRFAREVLVLHLPGVIHDVEGAVADEEWQRPRPHPFPFAAAVGPHRGDVGPPMSNQSVRGECATLRDAQPHLPREVLALGADGVPDDPVAV